MMQITDQFTVDPIICQCTAQHTCLPMIKGPHGIEQMSCSGYSCIHRPCCLLKRSIRMCHGNLYSLLFTISNHIICTLQFWCQRNNFEHSIAMLIDTLRNLACGRLNSIRHHTALTNRIYKRSFCMNP